MSITTPRSTVCFVAAHSGGHMLPCLTLARQLQSRHQILFVSLDRPLERGILQQAPTVIDQLAYVNLPKFPYRKFWLYPQFVRQLFTSLRTSYRILKQAQATRVITTGGVSAIPVCYAARLLRIPIELYELNLEPGLAVQWIAPVAHTIKVCFPISKRYFRANDQARCELVRYPVRFTAQELALTKTHLLQTLPPKLASFTAGRKTILILGGSQGSAFLNSLAAELLKLPLPIQVIHQVGGAINVSPNASSMPALRQTAALTTSGGNFKAAPGKLISEFQALYQAQQTPAYVFSYDADMAPLYTLADVVITRAGAGVLAELACFGRPAVIIPLQTAQTAHQVANANSWSQLYPQLFRVVTQNELEREPALLLTKLQELW